MKQVKKVKLSNKKKKSLTVRKISRGTVSPNIFLILLIVLLIFLGFMFFQGGANNNSTPTTPNGSSNVVTLPTLGETGGGLNPLNLTPFPTSFIPKDSKCRLITNDIMLVLDNSGSMKGNKLAEAKIAAKIFVTIVAVNPDNRVGLVVFNKNSTIMSALTKDYALVGAQIDNIREASNTCIQCGVLDGNRAIHGSLRDGAKRSVVLLSDGKANHVNGAPNSKANELALAEIKKGYAADQTAYYTIAFGKDANKSYMQKVAADTGGVSYSSASEKDLAPAFSSAATQICQ